MIFCMRKRLDYLCLYTVFYTLYIYIYIIYSVYVYYILYIYIYVCVYWINAEHYCAPNYYTISFSIYAH